jgi:hypothetical protein
MLDTVPLTWPTTPVHPVGRELLDQSLARLELQLPAHRMFLEEPALWPICQRLAAYLGDEVMVPSRQDRILDRTLQFTVSRFFSSGSMGDPLPLALATLSRTAAHVLCLRVRDGHDLWHPLRSAPLTDWRRDHVHARIERAPAQWASISLRGFREHLFFRLLTLPEAAARELTPQAFLLDH